MIKGQVVSGEFGKIVVRQKSDQKLELGELLVADTINGKILMQVYDLLYGSQISQQNLELISGLNIEENTDLEFIEPHLKNYNIALLKPMIFMSGKDAHLCKSLPNFFSEVRQVSKDDLVFLTKPQKALFLGKLRSGSKMLDVDIFLPGLDVFSHHILIPATTGRGKSNLCSVLLWDQCDKDYCGVLVLDPHDEYYGRNKFGLKDNHSGNVIYYTSQNVPPGAKSLKINMKNLTPGHFNGVVNWSDPQKQSLAAYYKKYGKNWIEAIIMEKPLDVMFNELTFGVVRRRILSLLNLDFINNQLFCNGVFELSSGENTINDICQELEQSKTVIIDTSNFSGAVEILIGSMITTEIYSKYKYYKKQGSLDSKPVISIILEEAPRVLGKEVLEKGSNIFSTIAREGRKFKVGLTAITQLPSLIPRQILANMNTKIILGIEMQSERQAIIESASQDLSTDNRNIASLDKGEAIITSNFARFATPVKIPLFEEFAKSKEQKYEKSFSGINIEKF